MDRESTKGLKWPTDLGSSRGNFYIHSDSSVGRVNSNLVLRVCPVISQMPGSIPGSRGVRTKG